MKSCQIKTLIIKKQYKIFIIWWKICRAKIEKVNNSDYFYDVLSVREKCCLSKYVYVVHSILYQRISYENGNY